MAHAVSLDLQGDLSSIEVGLHLQAFFCSNEDVTLTPHGPFLGKPLKVVSFKKVFH